MDKWRIIFMNVAFTIWLGFVAYSMVEFGVMAGGAARMAMIAETQEMAE